VLVAQGNLAKSLLEAAAAIVPDTGRVVTVSNQDCALSGLPRRMSQALSALRKGDVVIFTDMLGSSCFGAARNARTGRRQVALICGVNLPMLIRFFMYRERSPFSDLVALVEEAGRQAVRSVRL
jgi:PTS system mannose-specific IIA component